MHAEMGMNLIRIWGGGLTERPAFYDACDELGVMVMQDFWMSGDCNGNFGLRPEEELLYPDATDDAYDVYIRAVRDATRMLRNRPSLVLWIGGNEIAASDGQALSPPEYILSAMREAIGGHLEEQLSSATLDGKRPFLKSSSHTEDRTLSICRVDGPYGIRDPRSWFEEFPGIDDQWKPVGFNAETGNVGLPVVESLRKFMSEETLADFPAILEGGDADGANEVWDFHKYIAYHDGITDYIYQYGVPTTIDEFAEQAQMASYVQYRALLEGYTRRMWDSYTGVLIWKSQGPWTDMRGNQYDWYLQQKGGFWGAKEALKPQHVQLNLDDAFETSPSDAWTLSVVNLDSRPLENAVVKSTIYDLSGSVVYEQTSPGVTIPEDSVQQV
jgi:mannosylglycoprotein endo-beta-mannosidase